MKSQKKVIHIKIPFIAEVNNTNMRQEITEFLGRFYNQIKFKFNFNNQLSIKSFFLIQGLCSLRSAFCVVYKFSCGKCTSTCIGEAYCHLSTRLAEHEVISVRTGQTLLNPRNSSISDLALQAGHDIDPNWFKTIRKSKFNSISISESIS